MNISITDLNIIYISLQYISSQRDGKGIMFGFAGPMDSKTFIIKLEHPIDQLATVG